MYARDLMYVNLITVTDRVANFRSCANGILEYKETPSIADIGQSQGIQDTVFFL